MSRRKSNGKQLRIEIRTNDDGSFDADDIVLPPELQEYLETAMARVEWINMTVAQRKVVMNWVLMKIIGVEHLARQLGQVLLADPEMGLSRTQWNGIERSWRTLGLEALS